MLSFLINEFNVLMHDVKLQMLTAATAIALAAVKLGYMWASGDVSEGYKAIAMIAIGIAFTLSYQIQQSAPDANRVRYWIVGIGATIYVAVSFQAEGITVASLLVR